MTMARKLEISIISSLYFLLKTALWAVTKNRNFFIYHELNDTLNDIEEKYKNENNACHRI
jgi:hypothetical protein